MNEPTQIAPMLINKKQAAKMLGLCVRSIENHVKARRLSVIKLGKRCIRFRPEDIADFANRSVSHAVE